MAVVTGPCPVLVERDEELRLLSALAGETATRGEPRVVVITGEAGVGKSRLARDFLATLPEGWTAATHALTRSGTTLPDLPGARPLAVVVDDAHWLDPAVLGELGTPRGWRADGAALLLLAFRLGQHAPGSDPLRALARLVLRERVREIRLAPLSPSGVMRMAAAMGRYDPGDLYDRSAGNPFFVEEVLRGGGPVPWTVAEAVAGRLEPLPPAARSLARLLAVAGEPVPVPVAARLVDDLDAAHLALAGAGLAAPAGGALSLRHVLVGEALLLLMGPVEAAAWHARLAEALERERTDPARLACHWAAAGRADLAAGPARQAAGRLRERGALRSAVELYAIALVHPDPDAARAAETYRDAAATAALVGDYPRVREWAAAAEECYRRAGDPERAARLWLDPAFTYVTALRRTLANRDDSVERLLLDARAAVRRGEADLARDLAGQAEALTRERGDGMALNRAAMVTFFCLGDFEHGTALFGEAARSPSVAAHPERLSRVVTTQSRARFAQGFPGEAVAAAREAVAISRRHPEAVGGISSRLVLGHLLLLTGEIEEAERVLNQVAASEPPIRDAVTAVTRGFCLAERGEPGAGLPSITAGVDGLLSEVDLGDITGPVLAVRMLTLRAFVELYAGRHDLVLASLRRAGDLCPEPLNDTAADRAHLLARVAVELPDPELLPEAEQAVDHLARQLTGPNVTAAAEAVHGLAARSGGRTDEALRRFQAAAALFERAPRFALAAELWCDAAAAAGPGPASTAALGRARALCERHGLGRVARRAGAVERELSGRRAAVPPLLAQLTPREIEVVRLAAEGLTNRQIGARLYLSEGTVRNYLSTAFAKLGVSRRAAVAHLLAGADTH
jgi:DNA-binding CsgD family transcriptional regulator/tetratricopeptide (TPR) repeat protein